VLPRLVALWVKDRLNGPGPVDRKPRRTPSQAARRRSPQGGQGAQRCPSQAAPHQTALSRSSSPVKTATSPVKICRSPGIFTEFPRFLVLANTRSRQLLVLRQRERRPRLCCPLHARRYLREAPDQRSRISHGRAASRPAASRAGHRGPAAPPLEAAHRRLTFTGSRAWQVSLGRPAWYGYAAGTEPATPGAVQCDQARSSNCSTKVSSVHQNPRILAVPDRAAARSVRADTDQRSLGQRRRGLS
jgi:hypothetical protein